MHARDAKGVALLAVALASLTAVSAANARGTTYGPLGLSYTGTTTNWTEFPGRASQTTYDPCADPNRLVGLGAWVGESVPTVPNYSDFPLGKAFNVSILPFDYPELTFTPDATKQVAENRFESDPGNFIIGESTVCAEDAQSLRYPSVAKRSRKRARTTAKIACPDGRHVLSGGALAGGPFRSQRLVSTAPFDSDDPGTNPDDGWRVSVDNLQRTRRKIKAYAICTSSQDLSYVSDEFTATNGSRSHIEPTCPGGEFVIGGGVRHDIGYRKATLVASRVASPFPGSKWIVELDNLSQASAQGRAFAICHA